MPYFSAAGSSIRPPFGEGLEGGRGTPGPEARAFVLYALRCWLAYGQAEPGGAAARCAFLAMESAFDRLGGPLGRRAFLSLMGHLSKQGRALDGLPLRMQRQTRDETRFLDVIGALQAGNREAAQDALSAWLPEAALAPALRDAALLALALEASGCRLDRAVSTVPSCALH